ncbi:hypothetical protein EVAR_103536_1 [Eumeta japonica]|uniref:LIM zinc-binding domain-containing protein n=1 Tax=Eumeta variegata TaxID=151549 RepID=A0A4C1YHC3_EUMVA|nr:hypothetical protein EVAR_103536_1 [Eumeta japonica]
MDHLLIGSASVRRRYGTKCSGCGHGISPSDLVRKAREKVFHLNCFTCLVCRKQLSTGEELYVLDDNKFICKEDYLAGKAPTQHHCEYDDFDYSSYMSKLEIYELVICKSYLANNIPSLCFEKKPAKCVSGHTQGKIP